MQTTFTLAQLADPDIAEADKILRACVHCGFCNATCPTYVLLGDELDSPRGRIYLIKDMLEHERPATAEVVTHIDRCLSCLACMTTCPSGVHYMHLVDHARAHIEETYRRPLLDRLMREFLAQVMPYPRRLRLRRWWRRCWRGRSRRCSRDRAEAAGRGAPARAAPRAGAVHRSPACIRAQGAAPRRGWRCSPAAPTRRWRPRSRRPRSALLNRHGVEVVIAPGEGCCGSLDAPHGPRGGGARAGARQRRRLDARDRRARGSTPSWSRISGCGTTVKDYGFMLRTDPAYAGKAAKVSALARDVSEYLADARRAAAGDALRPHGRLPFAPARCSTASACIGNRRTCSRLAASWSRRLPEAHLCCGSAGTYNILQPEIAGRLRDRKIGNIEKTAPDVIAAGNIGCITQIAAGTAIPVVHPVELIDWATGGPVPERLKGRVGA